MTESLSNEAVFCEITENLRVIEQNISDAAVQSGRRREDISFMAVTKTVPPVFINHVLQAGVNLIGENKVQELLEKKEFLSGNYEAHLIGHLQTNKVKKIINEVTMIQSVDSVRLACEIAKQAGNAGRQMDVLLEINIAKEESKSGFLPDGFEEAACEIAQMQALRVRGIMSVPPVCETEVQIRQWFSQVRRVFEGLQQQKYLGNMDVLSMGMSSDYREAILEGATLVRVGSALFGHRRY